MRGGGIVFATGVLFAQSGCSLSLGGRACIQDSDCLRGGVEGTCLPSPTSVTSWCAFHSDTCPSQLAWDTLSGDSLGGTCVDGAPVDGGMDAGPDASPDACISVCPPAQAAALFPWNGYTTGSVWATAASLPTLPRRPTFKWLPSPDATGYELEVDDSCPATDFSACDFPSPEIALPVMSTSTTLAGDLPVSTAAPVGRRYFWRVRACNTIGCGPWSATRYVDVARLPNDFNGDGYGDLAVGAYMQDAPAMNEGNAFVYYGSVSGFPGSPSTTLDDPGNDVDAFFGHRVASAGDLNADGFSDLAVSARGQSNPAGGEGNVFIYLGSATGVATAPTLTLDNPANQPGGDLGRSVASAGDVNGDGYADLVVGADMQDNGSIDEGNAFVFYGSLGGVPLSPSVTLDSPTSQMGAHFGYDSAGIGDVNGDGYTDMAIAATEQASGASYEGNVFLFHGSATGIPTTPSVTVDNPYNEAYAQFGRSVSGADVNGDGYSDLVVGCFSCSAPEVAEGTAFLYYGGPSGIPTTPSLTFDNPADQLSAHFGGSVRAADVNADGFADICVGAHAHSDVFAGEGRAFLYYGTPSGTTPSPAFDNPADQGAAGLGWAVTIIGDANGDGFGEVVLGAYMQDAGAMNEGNGFVYHTTATGTPTTPSLILDNPANQADGYFGGSVLR